MSCCSGLWNWRSLWIEAFLAVWLYGCASSPNQEEGPTLPAAPMEPDTRVGWAKPVTFSLGLVPGTKTRYRATTEVAVAVEVPHVSERGGGSILTMPKFSEASEIVFIQEILGPAPGDANGAAAMITIEQVRCVRTLPGQPDLAFDSERAADRNSPFANLIGQVYTIEIHPLGYAIGVFNLDSPRLAVRGDTAAHAAALDQVDPATIFLRHGYFSLPGPDLGPVAVGTQWRGLQQFILEAPGTNLGRPGVIRFEKTYRLERVEQRSTGTTAEVTFAGSPVSRRGPDGGLITVPFLSYLYAGGGEFNLDAGRIERYLENLEVRMPMPETASMPGARSEGQTVIVTRSARTQRLDL